MDLYNKDGDRAQSPCEEDEDDDGEEHEQIRLVETPDPVIFSRMENGNGIHLIGDLYRAKVLPNSNEKSKDFTSIQCQNEFYTHTLRSREIKESSKSDLKKICIEKCQCSPVEWLLSIIPILSWLPNYNWKSDLAYDIAAGFTVAVMHIPQGMAYAMLSNVEPIIGLYMAFYPVIMYSLVGTSKHISIGTFAVVCLMSGKVASERVSYYSFASTERVIDNLSEYDSSENETVITVNGGYTTEEIATAVSLCVGLWQILMGILQLGSLSVLLSAELISGFTTGSAVHVLTSQMKNLLGLKIARRNGIFKIPLTYVDIMMGLKEANITAVLLSAVTISLLVIYNELLKPLLNKRIPFPIPVELITIIVGTLVSRFWITSATYGISIVSHIPTGLPDPALPPLEIVPDILVDSLIIAIVGYAISISMAKIFATKHQYEVRANQELLANGSSNIFGSFFSCAPIAASLSRSLIQEQVGGKTQLTGLFSCTTLLFVLLWIGPFFETLPHCILSSLIVVALKGMFMQVSDLPKAWKQSRVNGLIWFVSFLSTVLLDIEYGLVIGLILAVSSLLWRSSMFEAAEMGKHINSHLVVEKKPESTMVAEIPGVKIIKLTGSLNFATVDSFASKLNTLLNKMPYYLRRRSSGRKASATANFPTISALILDFSSVSSVDPAAIKSILDIQDAQKKQGINVFYVGCPSSVLQVMDHCKFVQHVNAQYFYATIDHALQSVETTMGTRTNGELTSSNPYNSSYDLTN